MAPRSISGTKRSLDQEHEHEQDRSCDAACTEKKHREHGSSPRARGAERDVHSWREGGVMGLFGPKIVCDQCNKKVKEAISVYFRGSRFCDAACVDGWNAANPAPVAKGDPAKLREELAMLID